MDADVDGSSVVVVGRVTGSDDGGDVVVSASMPGANEPLFISGTIQGISDESERFKVHLNTSMLREDEVTCEPIE